MGSTWLASVGNNASPDWLFNSFLIPDTALLDAEVMRGRFCKKEALRKTHGKEDGHWVANAVSQPSPSQASLNSSNLVYFKKISVLVTYSEIMEHLKQLFHIQKGILTFLSLPKQTPIKSRSVFLH